MPFLLRERPEGACKVGFVEGATNRRAVSPLKIGLGAASIEKLRQGKHLRRAHDVVPVRRRTEICLVEPGVELLLVRKDEELVVSGRHEVVVPFTQGRTEAHHRRTRAAAHHLAIDERLRDHPPGAVAHGPDHRRRTAKHDVLPPKVPISVAI